ncbi:hypothetical protein LTR86_000634 [Recurvomyces mirabilis]|nr:hypothetical protein LTR86_000634 [Recurvomyces mirabilis]
MSVTMASQDACTLLQLPLELREQIYIHVLRPDRITINVPGLLEDNDPVMLAYQDPITTPFVIAKDKTIPKHFRRAALLRTCKTVYSEARRYLYEPKTLALLQFQWQGDQHFKRMDARLLGRMRHVQNISVNFSEVPWRGDITREAAICTKVIVGCLQPNLQIRALDLTFRAQQGVLEEEWLSSMLEIAAHWFRAARRGATVIQLEIYFVRSLHDRAKFKLGGDGTWVDATDDRGRGYELGAAKRQAFLPVLNQSYQLATSS